MPDTPATEQPTADAPTERPPGEYAIVELFGHATLVGRIEEVERFGAKMLAIEPLFRDSFLPAVFHGGASIYRLTPCSADVAFKQQPRQDWSLPPSIRAIVPPLLLETPASSMVHDAHPSDDDEDLPL